MNKNVGRLTNEELLDEFERTIRVGAGPIYPGMMRVRNEMKRRLGINTPSSLGFCATHILRVSHEEMVKHINCSLKAHSYHHRRKWDHHGERSEVMIEISLSDDEEMPDCVKNINSWLAGDPSSHPSLKDMMSYISEFGYLGPGTYLITG